MADTRKLRPGEPLHRVTPAGLIVPMNLGIALPSVPTMPGGTIGVERGYGPQYVVAPSAGRTTLYNLNDAGHPGPNLAPDGFRIYMGYQGVDLCKFIDGGGVLTPGGGCPSNPLRIMPYQLTNFGLGVDGVIEGGYKLGSLPIDGSARWGEGCPTDHHASVGLAACGPRLLIHGFCASGVGDPIQLGFGSGMSHEDLLHFGDDFVVRACGLIGTDDTGENDRKFRGTFHRNVMIGTMSLISIRPGQGDLWEDTNTSNKTLVLDGNIFRLRAVGFSDSNPRTPSDVSLGVGTPAVFRFFKVQVTNKSFGMKINIRNNLFIVETENQHHITAAYGFSSQQGKVWGDFTTDLIGGTCLGNIACFVNRTSGLPNSWPTAAGYGFEQVFYGVPGTVFGITTQNMAKTFVMVMTTERLLEHPHLAALPTAELFPYPGFLESN